MNSFCVVIPVALPANANGAPLATVWLAPPSVDNLESNVAFPATPPKVTRSTLQFNVIRGQSGATLYIATKAFKLCNAAEVMVVSI